jgi:HAD superfamily hydrolase (TIGR01509 family)
MKNNIKGIIFDLDGTLFDSCGMWHKIDVDFFKKRNMDIPKDYNKKIAPLGLAKAAEFTKSEYGIKEPIEEIIKEWHDMAVYEYTCNVNIKPFVKEYLELCKNKGLKLAIATANDEEFYMPALKRNRIVQYFDFICDVNEFKGTKNTPDIYLHVANSLNLSPCDMAVFEDIPRAIKSAKEGGFFVVAVDDAHEVDLVDEKKKLADRFIYSFEELLEKKDQ